MKRFLPLFLLFTAPVAVFALNYTDHSRAFGDAPFPKPEAAAISLLWSEGVVQGYPDGTFHPERTLNRAEFLKIAILAAGKQDQIADADSADCFPDVSHEDWFSPFVCYALRIGVVRGYPDGGFHPEREVNYVEALKMLSELFAYQLSSEGGDEWFSPYVRAASEHRTILPVSIELDAFLMRGLMARLAAAFLAESKGELDLYRLAEQGKKPVRSSASSTSSSRISVSSSSLSTTSSSAASSSSVSVTDLPDLPAQSHLLMLGERTEPIASAAFFSSREPMLIRGVTVVMEADFESLDTLYLINAEGKQIGRLSLDPLDTTDKTWKANFATEGAYLLEKDTQNVLAIEALLKPRNGGGISGELVEVDNWYLTVEGGYTHNTYNSLTPGFPFPKHQTVQAKVTEVKNTLEAEGNFAAGSDQLVAGFSFFGEAVQGATLAVEHLEFQVSKPTSVTVSGWELGASDTATRVQCSMSDATVSCTNIPAELGTIGSSPRGLRLFVDVSLASGAQNPFLQVILNQAGSIGVNGAVRWTDGTSDFNWVEMETPVARGTYWK